MAKHPDTSAGFSDGIKYWLVFMISLFALGYKSELSICLGAIGGIAGGVISAWWKPKDDLKGDQPAAKEAKAESNVEDKPPVRRPSFSNQGSVRRRQRPNRGIRHFGWLFRNNKK